MGIADHLTILPILLPLFAGVVLTLIEDRRHQLKLGISMVACGALLVVALQALVTTMGGPETPAIVSYRVGNWPAPFAIVLVMDRLAAMMVLLTAVLALASLTFSSANWHRAGSHFHTLFQLLLMGINGAFLTGDLFNLFVFFEILLAASYGLTLHGSGVARVRAGLHYIVINLATSSLFLIGVSLIYAVTGTLNMADLATRIPELAGDSRTLLETGAAVLGIAFLVKAGMWPLGFWLPTTYAAAAPPVAALFAITSKVGVYVILRLSVLLFGDGSGPSAHFGDQFLILGGMATMAFGTVGVLASQGMSRIAGFSVLISSGTLLAMIGYESAGVTAAALFYLVSSTLTLTSFFLLIELVERGRAPGASVLAVTLEVFGDDEEPEHDREIGIATPMTLSILGISFACCGLLLAGMPPFSGFLAKFAMLTAILNPQGLGAAAEIASGSWILIALLIISGLAAMVAMLRAGINTFWAPLDSDVPEVRHVELGPVVMLLALCLLLTVSAGPVLEFMDVTAASLHAPLTYVEGVLGSSTTVQTP